jgi:riboflavin kinase/FMN adenylyltransferase
LIVTRDRRELPPPPAGGSVVSVGVFDGVHLGHQAVLAANVARARGLGARPTVVTFQEHPKKVLLGRAPKTLTSLEHRLELFRRAGIEHTLALVFDDELRSTPAETFVEALLVRGLGARHFVLGFDSKFGRDREGGPDLVRRLGLPLEVPPRVVVAERAVSSSAIREAVELGDLAGAARMLGRPVAVFGDVVRGERLGSRLGFPTANLDLHHELHPPAGVYACRARLAGADGPARPAVCNIGRRPTVSGGAPPAEPTVEVHLLDYPGPGDPPELYGLSLEVELVRRLRDERRFQDLGALRDQIGADVAAARALLAEQAARAPASPGR